MKKYLISLCFLLVPIIAPAQVDTSTCFCVTLARYYSPAVPRLDAKYWPLLPPTVRSVPSLGGQILMEYETLYDVATIVAFRATGFEVIGVDFDTCKATRRIIPYNDPRIHSFYQF